MNCQSVARRAQSLGALCAASQGAGPALEQLTKRRRQAIRGTTFALWPSEKHVAHSWGRATFVAALLLPDLPACGSGSRGTEPFLDLSGVWDYSYSTQAARDCSLPAPPGLTPGCAGAGDASLIQAGEHIGGTIALYGYCQDCDAAGDSFGNTRSVTGQLRGKRLEFTSDGCRHKARCLLPMSSRSPAALVAR